MDATPFGQYQLQELIGRGGMGEVYRAFDTRTDRIVALKLLPTHLAKDTVFQQRFRRESQAAAGINEPHVVPIHGFGEIDERLYLDMRLIDGNNLGALLGEDDNKKPLKPAMAVSIIEQVAAALDAAHELGLIHRDVKPSNILVTKNDFAYLIDFGLARTAGQQGLTTAGSTLGTMAYMSPERFEGGEIDPRSDVYALTCVLYECLTGQKPYPVDSLEQQIAKHIMRPRRSRPPSIRGWPHSTRSSPRACPRSRAGAINRRARWPPPRAARRMSRCGRRAARVGIRRVAPRRVRVAAACPRRRWRFSAPRCCWVRRWCSGRGTSGAGVTTKNRQDHRRRRRRRVPPTTRTDSCPRSPRRCRPTSRSPAG